MGGNLSQISSVLHVWWWNLITSAHSIQVVNNRNDHFKYFLGVCVVSFIEKVNKEDKFGDFSYCPHNRGCPLNTGFTVIGNNLVKSPNVVAAFY